MGISNFSLLGIAVIHRDVERTLKSQSLKGKSVKNENGLSRRRRERGRDREVGLGAVVWCADMRLILCVFWAGMFGCFSNDCHLCSFGLLQLSLSHSLVLFN